MIYSLVGVSSLTISGPRAKGDAMKTIVLLALAAIVFVLGVAASATAQSTTIAGEQFWFGQDGKTFQDEVNFLGMKPIGSTKWFLSVWGQWDEGWGQITPGVGYNMTSWSSVTFQFGVEKHPGVWRTNGTLWVGGRGYNSLLILETGASGYWYKYLGTKKVSSRLDLGAISQRFVGTGPVIQVHLSKFVVWSAPVTLKTDGSVSNLSGVTYSFY